jgi:hypothetical protein
MAKQGFFGSLMNGAFGKPRKQRKNTSVAGRLLRAGLAYLAGRIVWGRRRYV